MEKHIEGGPRIACVTPTDVLLTAGVSNWGGYAVAAATALVKHFRRTGGDIGMLYFIVHCLIFHNVIDHGGTVGRQAYFTRHSEILTDLAFCRSGE